MDENCKDMKVAFCMVQPTDGDYLILVDEGGMPISMGSKEVLLDAWTEMLSESVLGEKGLSAAITTDSLKMRIVETEFGQLEKLIKDPIEIYRLSGSTLENMPALQCQPEFAAELFEEGTDVWSETTKRYPEIGLAVVLQGLALLEN